MPVTGLRLIVLGLLVVLFTFPLNAAAQAAPEYRALWVETFNTALGTRTQIDAVVNAAAGGNMNAIFAQIRRRGDSWYLQTLEPLTMVAGVGEPDATGTWQIDPLAYLIQQAHAKGIEVHAFVIVGAIFNGNPTVASTMPKDMSHAFHQHVWDPVTKALYPLSDPRQWATRTLPHNRADTTFEGHRFGSPGVPPSEWYLDLGHPDAAAYTVDVLTHLVSRYDLDGLHLDRIRYPEAPMNRGLGRVGINVGYNETSVNRFKTRHGAAAGYFTEADLGTNVNPSGAAAIIGEGDIGYPKPNDPLWSDWRREQVTNLVRRIYLNVTAVKPRIKVSAATICFWTGPAASRGWTNTEAYYRVFQDWQSWVQEGILDIAAPMIYKREHSLSERAQFDDWLSFTKELAAANGRHSIPGLGAYINGLEGTLRQARKATARAPFEASVPAADGVIFYALGNSLPGGGSTSAAVTANPFALPTAGVNTPKRSNADFFSSLVTGANVAGTVRFESAANAPLFGAYMGTPDMPWKTAPALGHAMGFAIGADGVALDGAIVTIEPAAGGAPRMTRTDGGGFFGAVGLAPGRYRARIELGSTRLDVCGFDVTPGAVATLTPRRDTLAPVTTLAIDPAAPQGANGWYLGDVRLTLSALDDCSGVARTEYSLDGGASWQLHTDAIVISTEGQTTVHYRSADAAGNVEDTTALVVRLDKTAPVVTLTGDQTELWPPNGQLEPIVLTGSASDAGVLTSVTYQVVDEYGMTFEVAPRALTGSSATWSDRTALESRRDGTDLDGRQYRVTATVRDEAGRTSSATVTITVLHDRR